MRGFHAILVSIRTGRSGLFSGADTDLQVLWAADVDNAFPATHRKAKLPFPSVRRGMLGITAVRDACVALHRPSDSLGDFLGADYARFLPPFSGYVEKEGHGNPASTLQVAMTTEHHCVSHTYMLLMSRIRKAAAAIWSE
jgi:hypothetical protein